MSDLKLDVEGANDIANALTLLAQQYPKKLILF